MFPSYRRNNAAERSVHKHGIKENHREVAQERLRYDWILGALVRSLLVHFAIHYVAVVDLSFYAADKSCYRHLHDINHATT